MDVSDGLVQDLGRLCRAIGCGSVLEAALVPLSPGAAAHPALLPLCLSGGDDYELRRPPRGRGRSSPTARAAYPVTRIGAFQGRRAACHGNGQ
jgi:thiamine-monophosphate kinase